MGIGLGAGSLGSDVWRKMMYQFVKIEVPIAISMIELADRATHTFQMYFCYWAAFNNIYTLIGHQQGAVPRFATNSAGDIKPHKLWGYTFPRVITPSERDLIQIAIQQLDAQVKHALIVHPNAGFFVERIPMGAPGQHDSQGQLINGVLNITRTVNQQSPVWSPIDKQAYQRYIAGDQTDQDLLAEQIIFLLYTVRNNLVHGSKSSDEANDVKVVENALPLLALVVKAFLI